MLSVATTLFVGALVVHRVPVQTWLMLEPSQCPKCGPLPPMRMPD